MKRTLLFVLLVGFLTAGMVRYHPAAARAISPIPLTSDRVSSSPTEASNPLPTANPPEVVQIQSTQPSPTEENLAVPAVPVTSVQALAEPSRVEENTAPEWVHRQHLSDFIDSLSTGASDDLVGVYVPDVFALPVLQQPPGQAGFVSEQDNSVTQFSAPKQYGVVGLLAHNFLSGQEFFRLEVGQQVALVYGDRQVKYFQINRIERFQALSPNSPYSDFINLADPEQKVISSGQLYNQIYTTEDQVVFQTCIEAEGDPSWGRIFVIADPIEPLTGGF